MGVEFTDPLKACCCANQMKASDHITIGNNSDPSFDDYLQSNISWIIRIQAHWRAKVQRMRYQKQRDNRRSKSTHFLIQDQNETISKRRHIELRILFYANEAELTETLEIRQHRYRTSGATYDGQWLGGFRHGRGTMQFRDGASYEGTWYLGRAHGFGKFTHVKGETYEGEWADDYQHGKGLSTHVNFYKYEGQFRKGVMEGVGKETWPDGALFCGNFVNGKKNGFGFNKWSDGQTYTGNYKDGLLEGFGHYMFSDGREFTGEWKNQKIYGFGVYNYPDGKRYEGFYKLDKKHGFGIYAQADGNTYSGAFYEGKQHGYGCMYTSKNVIKYGLYNRGQRIFKLTPEQATDVQDGEIDLQHQNFIQTSLGDDKLTYFGQINILSNRFEPFDNFATEQAKFELGKCSKDEKHHVLKQKMQELDLQV